MNPPEAPPIRSPFLDEGILIEKSFGHERLKTVLKMKIKARKMVVGKYMIDCTIFARALESLASLQDGLQTV